MDRWADSPLLSDSPGAQGRRRELSQVSTTSHLGRHRGWNDKVSWEVHGSESPEGGRGGREGEREGGREGEKEAERD